MINEQIGVNKVVAELKSIIDESLLPQDGKDILEFKNMRSVLSLRKELGPRPGGLKIPFYSRHTVNGYMSNFRGPAGRLMIWGEDWKSPQVFIGYWRNLLLGEKRDAEFCRTLYARPGNIKRNSVIAEKKVSMAAWALITGELLALANLQKYRCDVNLRDKLVRTTGDLVETNTGSLVFASGVNDDDPALHNPEQWPRLNLAGSILEFVREESRKESELFFEASTSDQQRSRSGSLTGPFASSRSRKSSLAGDETGSVGGSRRNSLTGSRTGSGASRSRVNSLADSDNGSAVRSRANSLTGNKRERDNETGGDDVLSTTGKKKAK